MSFRAGGELAHGDVLGCVRKSSEPLTMFFVFLILSGRLVMRLRLRFKQNADVTRLVNIKSNLLFMGPTLFLRSKHRVKKSR